MAGPVAQAVFNGSVVAETEGGLLVEGNVYFPPEDVDMAFLVPAEGSSFCPWKGGKARYFDVVAGGQTAPGAAWCYPETGPAAKEFEGWFGFWRGVTVTPGGAERAFKAPGH